MAITKEEKMGMREFQNKVGAKVPKEKSKITGHGPKSSEPGWPRIWSEYHKAASKTNKAQYKKKIKKIK